MRQFRVHLYYHGCYSTFVEAKDESEAIELAEQEIEQMEDIKFLQEIDLINDGNDIYEIAKTH